MCISLTSTDGLGYDLYESGNINPMVPIYNTTYNGVILLWYKIILYQYGCEQVKYHTVQGQYLYDVYIVLICNSIHKILYIYKHVCMV